MLLLTAMKSLSLFIKVPSLSTYIQILPIVHTRCSVIFLEKCIDVIKRYYFHHLFMAYTPIRD